MASTPAAALVAASVPASCKLGKATARDHQTALAHKKSGSEGGSRPASSANCCAAGSSRSHVLRSFFWRNLQQDAACKFLFAWVQTQQVGAA
jgi:hypothetical protein